MTDFDERSFLCVPMNKLEKEPGVHSDYHPRGGKNLSGSRSFPIVFSKCQALQALILPTDRGYPPVYCNFVLSDLALSDIRSGQRT